MEFTLDQIRALDAVAREGSFTKAATKLKKGHTGVLYLIKSLEQKTGLELFDRTGYRTHLTPVGAQVWEECRKLLDAEEDFNRALNEMAEGWEKELKMVIDGFLPVDPVLSIFTEFSREKIPTRFSLFSEYLSGVEDRFRTEEADMMISLVPCSQGQLKRISLAPITAKLVAHRDHPLVTSKKAGTAETLSQHILVMVRGSDQRLGLSTRHLDSCSNVQLGDFYAKKTAIMNGLGFGWLPDYLIQEEMKKGILRTVKWEKPSEHIYVPVLYHRGENRLGRAGRRLLTEVRRHFVN